MVWWVGSVCLKKLMYKLLISLDIDMEIVDNISQITGYLDFMMKCTICVGGFLHEQSCCVLRLSSNAVCVFSTCREWIFYATGFVYFSAHGFSIAFRFLVRYLTAFMFMDPFTKQTSFTKYFSPCVWSLITKSDITYVWPHPLKMWTCKHGFDLLSLSQAFIMALLHTWPWKKNLCFWNVSGLSF